MNSGIEELFEALSCIGGHFRSEGYETRDGERYLVGIEYDQHYHSPDDYYNYRSYNTDDGSTRTHASWDSTDLGVVKTHCENIKNTLAKSNSALADTWGVTEDFFDKLNNRLCDEIMSFKGDIVAFIESTKANEASLEKATQNVDETVQGIFDGLGVE